MKRIFSALLFVIVVAFSAQSQTITDSASLRAAINTYIGTNGSGAITGTRLNSILNGAMNVLGKKVDSLWIASDTLFFKKNGSMFYYALPAPDCPATGFADLENNARDNSDLAAELDKGVKIVADISELNSYTRNNNTTVFVRDAQRGGIFYYAASATDDNGITFAAAGGGHWVRRYDNTQPVNVNWWRDGVVSDYTALSSALVNGRVSIPVNLTVAQTATISSGTIQFADGGSITVSSTYTLTLNCRVIAGDNDYVFKGAGTILLGTKSCKYVSVAWFGAKADCVGTTSGSGTDNYTPFTTAIAAARFVSNIYIPGAQGDSSYRTSASVTFIKTAVYWNFVVYGDGWQRGNFQNNKATMIFADFLFGPCINVQSARRTTIQNLGVVGRNVAAMAVWSNTAINRTNQISDVANYVTAGVNTGVNGYDSTYTGFATDKVNSQNSDEVTFKNVFSKGFYAGFYFSQAAGQNGDRMNIEDNSLVEGCTYGVILGNAQNRSHNYTSLNMQYIYCAYANNITGTGSLFNVQGGQIILAYKLFDLSVLWDGQASINGLYAENISSIGTIGTSITASSSIAFTGCYFKLIDNGYSSQGSGSFWAPYYTLGSRSTLIFTGCKFYTQRPFIAFYEAQTGTNRAYHMTFNGCSIWSYGGATPPLLKIYGSYSMEDSYMLPGDGTTTIYNDKVYTNINTASKVNIGLQTNEVINISAGTEAGVIAPAADEIHRGGIKRRYSKIYVSVGTSSLSVSNDTATFNVSAGTYEPYLTTNLIAGDTLYSQVSGVAESVGIFCPMMRVLSYNTSTKQMVVKLFSDQYDLSAVAMHVKSFFTTVPVTGNTTSGSSVITSVTNSSLLNVGDWIGFKQQSNKELYRIAAIDNGLQTVTLLGTATATISNANIINCEMVPEENYQVEGGQTKSDTVRVGTKTNYAYSIKTNDVERVNISKAGSLYVGNSAGGTLGTAKLQVSSTALQFRTEYDATHGMDISTISTGGTTFTLNGTSPSYTFNTPNSLIMRLTNTAVTNGYVDISSTATGMFRLLNNSGYGIAINPAGSDLNVPSSDLKIRTQSGNTLNLFLGGQDINPTTSRTFTKIEPVSSVSTAFAPTTGTTILYDWQNSGNTVFAPTSGNASFTYMRLRPAYNTTGSYSGTVMGLDIDPVNTSLTGATSIILRTVSGNEYFNSTSGNMGIGVASGGTLNARLQLPAGSSTAGTAPVNLPSGTVLGTKVNGTIEADNNSAYWTNANNVRLQWGMLTGASTKSGDAVTTSFTIAHGLGATPSYFNVVPINAASAGISYQTADATNITIVYTVAPASGTNNLSFKYIAVP